MRDAMNMLGGDSNKINPLVSVVSFQSLAFYYFSLSLLFTNIFH